MRHELFSEEEDRKLMQIVKKMSCNTRDVNWDAVARKMVTKNKRQCKDRWLNYLRSGLNNTEFTQEENHLLLTKVAELGHKWRMIAKFFDNRTDVSIKAQYRKLMRRGANLNNVFAIDITKSRKTKKIEPATTEKEKGSMEDIFDCFNDIGVNWEDPLEIFPDFLTIQNEE